MQSKLVALVLGAGLALAPAASAHHGWGSYDANNPLELSGTVESVRFENPHGVLMLATADKTWEVVLAPPFRMTNRGLRPEMIQVGETVEVMGYPHRSIETELRAEWIRINGTTTQLR
jgi:hypothetical protein